MVKFVFILLVISGISKAIMDKINFHYGKSVFRKKNAMFWHPVVSSQNKYKDGIKKRGPKFFGSTTFLVWTTDAWHLFGMIRGITFASVFLLLGLDGAPWWMVLLAYALDKVIFEVYFKWFFNLEDNGKG
jgi:hypothetical protein